MAFAQLNGRLNLADAEEVFRTVSAISAHTVTRVPDGETGSRRDRRRTLATALAATPGVIPAGDGCFALERGVGAAELELLPLGLAEAARESYAVFTRLRDAEAITPGTRFQVSVPWATAITPLVVEGDRDKVAAAYGRRLQREVEAVAEVVPPEDLAVHWEVPASGADDCFEDVSNWLPRDVPYGFHVCGYLSATVPVANALIANAARLPAWFSLPVPAERDDPAYFAPITDLRLPAGTALYLGLVHPDRLNATQRRIAVAKRFVDGFGIAAGCDMGELPREGVLKLLWLQLGARV